MRILILGKGQVGGALLKGLKVTSHIALAVGKQDINLCDERSAMKSITEYDPEVIVLAAGISRGFLYNRAHQFSQFLENCRMSNTALLISHKIGARFVNILPSCIYPKQLNHPHTPEDVLRNRMEDSSIGYSSAKVSSAVGVWAHNQEHQTRWSNVVLTNLYGSTSYEHGSHFIPHAITRILNARLNNLKHVTFNGSGKATRDFLHESDLSNAAPLIVDEKLYEHTGTYNLINVSGMGPITIAEVCEVVASKIGFRGKIEFSEETENGADSKLLNGEIFTALGWKPNVGIEKGIELCLENL